MCAAKQGMEDNGQTLAELRQELGQLASNLPHTQRLLESEIDRVLKGGDGKKPLAVHQGAPMKLTAKLLIPIKEFPKVNFVGKLIGPQGATLKRLQHELGVRLAIYGRGCMRDKNKEEELRKEGGKYAHLNDDLHVYMECSAVAEEAYERLGRAIAAVRPYFDPNFDDGNLAQRPDMQQGGDPYSNGVGRGGHTHGLPPPQRGMAPSGMRGRGGMSGMSGRGGAAPPMHGGAHQGSAPRGLLSERGASTGRGAPRGAPRGVSSYEPRGGGRGVGRGVASNHAPPLMTADPHTAYDEPMPDDYYGTQSRAPPAPTRSAPPAQSRGYEPDPYASASYGEHEPAYRSQPPTRDPYAAPPSRSTAADVQSFDYGHGGTHAAEYEDPQESWDRQDYGVSARTPAAPAPRGRGASAAVDYRQHPYERPAARQPMQPMQRY